MQRDGSSRGPCGHTTVRCRDRASRCRTRLLRALVARYGLEVRREVTADATAWGWEHREHFETMTNPAGYETITKDSEGNDVMPLAQFRTIVANVVNRAQTALSGSR